MKINDTFSFPFSLLSSTGASVNADSTPTFTLRRNGTTVATPTVTIVNTGTGEYRADVVFAAANGWVVGDTWTFRVSYIIATIPQTLSWAGKIRDSIENEAKAALIAQGYTIERAGYLTGDTFSRIGINGAGLTALGDTRIANLDATVSSRSTFSGGAVQSVTNPVTVNDKTGYSLAVTPPTASQIATAVEASLLNEGDSQQLINAIVGAIGNQNIDQIALVAALRADIERNDGKLTTVFNNYARRTGDYATEAQLITARTTITDAVATRQSANSPVTLPASAALESTSQSIKNKTDLIPAIPAAKGDAMTLISAERDAIAVSVESHLLNEGDSQMLINAIVGAIGSVDIDEVALVAAIRNDLERPNGNLNTLISRISEARLSKLDVTGTLANTSNADTFKANIATIPTAVASLILSSPQNKIVTDSQGNVSVILDNIEVSGLSPQEKEFLEQASNSSVIAANTSTQILNKLGPSAQLYTLKVSVFNFDGTIDRFSRVDIEDRQTNENIFSEVTSSDGTIYTTLVAGSYSLTISKNGEVQLPSHILNISSNSSMSFVLPE